MKQLGEIHGNETDTKEDAQPIQAPPGSSDSDQTPKPTPKQKIWVALQERERLLKEKLRLQRGLPFLYAWKWYPWAREFYESTTKLNLLCAANQISKSSTQIRKCINWATDQKLWPALWGHTPNQFWYLYPTGKQAKIEFETKWKQFLPAGEFKDDPVYGWKEEIKNKELIAIHFKSGVHVYFKTYAQNQTALQTGTVDVIFCDEELPEDLYDELIFRISASNGYFHMVFTATLGQDFWRKAMEPGPYEVENLPEARKWTVSMYDCLTYEDGTKSHWSEEKIKIVVNRCKSHAEILRRVYGKFIKETGRKYPQFDIKRHVRPKHHIPANWLIFGGVDIGSGGKEGHPSAIVFVGVHPNMQKGRVFLGWRGDGIPTTSGDVVQKYQQLKKENNLNICNQYYDFASKDFEIISSRMGESFLKADKSHEKGEDIINTLFKNDMLFIYDDEELQKLAAELSTLLIDTPKRKAKNDISDAFRYAVTLIPWDWSVITGKALVVDEVNTETSALQKELDERRNHVTEAHVQEQQRIEDEFDEWNEMYGL